MFLKNTWYVAGAIEAIAEGIHSTTIMSESIAIYRMSDGIVAALEDACPHRKLPLSMGRIQGDNLECGYHGLTFNCSGQCTKAPGSKRIPTKAQVKSYAVAERYGLIWVWMGDKDKADETLILEIDEWQEKGWGINRGDSMDIACHYLYITDNLLDPSHVAWVHQSSFGNTACEDTPLQTQVTEQGVVVRRWMFDVEVAPFYAKFVTFKGNCDRNQHYEVRFPSVAIIRALFTPAGSGGDDKALNPDVFLMNSYNFMTPIDEENTRYYWFQTRNFAPDDAAVSEDFATGVRHAFNEDKEILVAVQQGMANKKSPNIDLASDIGPMRFRNSLNKLIEQEQSNVLSPV